MSDRSATDFHARQRALVETRDSLFIILEAALGRALLAAARRWAAITRAPLSPEDLCQAAWLGLMRSSRLFELRSLNEMLRFAIGIVHNQAVSGSRPAPVELNELVLPTAQDRPILGIDFQRWLQALKPQEQHMVQLRMEGMTHDEIAVTLRIRPETARKRWSELIQHAPPFERSLT